MASIAGEWFSKNLNKFKSRSEAIKACAKAMGITVCESRRVMRQIENAGRKPLPITRVEPTHPSWTHTGLKMKTLADFKVSHDVEGKIRKILESLPKEGYISEQELKMAAQVETAEIARFRERFENNFLAVRDHGKQNIYWARAEMIKKMREVVEL